MTAPEPDAARCPLVSRRQFIGALGATVAVTTAGGWALGVWSGRGDLAVPTGSSTTTSTARSVPSFNRQWRAPSRSLKATGPTSGSNGM